MPRRRPRRRVAHSRPRPLPAFGANHVWAYDFVFDTCANDQTLKCLTVIDEFTRECLAIDVAGSIRSARVIEVLARLTSEHGAPKFLRSDNGPEFVSKAILQWLEIAGIRTALIDPGKPWQNGADERFNGRFRDECLSIEWFRSRREAKVIIELWRRHYNAVRPHSSLDYRTPIEFKHHHKSINQGPFPSNQWSEDPWAGHYGRRIAPVEPVFANLRHNKRLDRFTLRSRPKVNTQWRLYCLVHNIEKLAHQWTAAP